MNAKAKKRSRIGKLPLITDVLEIFAETDEGISLYKRKDLNISFENLLDNVFILSKDLAAYFEIRHDNLVKQNISKLQSEGHLTKQLLKIKELFLVGNRGRRFYQIYALTRHQTECVIMDLAGRKARAKKFAILKRLHAIERDVLQGDFVEARSKAQVWDGVQLIKKFGFTCSVRENIAIKKDIVNFLKIPLQKILKNRRKIWHSARFYTDFYFGSVAISQIN